MRGFRESLAPCVALLAMPAAALSQSGQGAEARAWARGAVCYEIFVRSFYDSDGDGIGDLNGLIQKLDYVNDGDPTTGDDLGAGCIWLMPVAASPSYHGYDVTDYYRVQHEYGTNEDLRRLMVEAHRRGIRVLVDLVLNHASSEYPYFKHALLHSDSPYRDWFLWLPEHPGVKNPWGGDNWHRSPVREEYYYGFFWSGMPDLNYENRAVREEAKRIATFWLTDLQVDGFRLDAIKHLVERDQGRVVEHVPATHAFLREFAAHVRSVAPQAFTIGEVWDSIGAMLPYYPDQLDAYFAFEASDAILESVRTGRSGGLLLPFLRLQEELSAERWAPFLRNHDQTRTLTALGGDVARAEVAATLLLTLPGLPFVYYGEELGMTGDKPDPRLRTPMHWSLGPAAGFTAGVPWEPLPSDSFTANVEVHEGDPRSLLNHYRRLIHLRSENPALGAGGLLPLTASDDGAAAYLRRTDDGAVLIIVNLGARELASVSLASEARVLPPARYRVTDLLGHGDGSPLEVSADGRIVDYVPVGTLGSYQSHVFELVQADQ